MADQYAVVFRVFIVPSEDAARAIQDKMTDAFMDLPEASGIAMTSYIVPVDDGDDPINAWELRVRGRGPATDQEIIMTPRHPLDGNAIAADRHYDQPAPTDHDCCDQCGCQFGDPDEDPECVVQHPTAFMWCETCAEAHGDEQ